MKSSTTRAFVAKKQSTSFTQVATNLLNVLQGYSKTIRLLLVMFLTLCVSAAWGETINFTDSKLPSGWSGTGSFDSQSNHYHSATPGYALATGKYLQTAEYTNITSLTFWGSTSNGGNGKSLTIQYKEKGSNTWNDLPSIVLNKSAQVQKTVTVTSLAGKTVSLKFSTTWNTAYLDDIEIVTASAQSHTITAISNNTDYGTVSLQGTTITAAPETGYRVSATTPYTISPAGSATVSQDGNTFSVTPSSDCTITINFEAIPQYTVTWKVNGEVYETTQVTEGSKPTFPATPASCDDESDTFYGWATATWDGKINDVSAKIIYTSANDMPEVNGVVTYYAVFAKTSEDSSGDYKLVTSLSNLKSGVAYLGSQISYSGVRYYYMTSTAISSNLLSISNATVSSNILQTPNSEGKINLVSTGAANQYYIKNAEGKYLYSNAAGSLSWSTTACSWTFSNMNSTTGLAELTSSANSNIKLRAYGTSTTQGKLKTYSGTTNYGICVFLAEATTTYSDYITTCTTEPSYSVTSNLSHVMVDPANPTRVLESAEELTLAYLPEDGWNLPATISVTMGGTPLSSETDYDWDNGDLLIAPASGFTGEIVVTINGWQQLAKPTGLNVTNITSTSATLSWGEVANASSYLVTIVDGGDLSADIPNTQTSHTFGGLTPSTEYLWTVKAIGDGITYTNSEESETGEFTTSPATCTVTYDANGGEGTIIDNTEYTNGATVTVLGNFGKLTKDGYAFTGWTDGSGNSYKHNDKFTITTNTTLYAQWCKAYWKLVTDAAELENDTRIVIAAKDYNFALSTTQATSNRGQAEITKKYNTITFGADVQTLSAVGPVNNNFALYSPGPLSIGYLYAASNSANQLKTKTTLDNNCYWSIGISETVASIYAQGDNSHNQIKYNHQQSGQLFSCYESSNTTMSAVAIYKEVCVQDQYDVNEPNLTNTTAANNNPTTVASNATSLTLNYSANTGYLLPETITVKMGGVALSSTDDYTWNKETGVLAINVDGFFGDIDVKIVAEVDPCYQFEMSEVTATSTTPNSITLTWTEVTGATGYNVKLGTGEFTEAIGLTHTFEGLTPKTTYNWEVQAVKDGADFHCEASKTGSTTTQKESFTVSWVVNGNTTTTESVVDGESITQYPSPPSAPSGCHEKVFVGWTKNPINTPTNEAPAILYKQKSDVPAITGNTTLHAVFATAIGGGSGNYELVESEPSDWSGTYLIVDGESKKCFDGSLTTLDANGNYESVTINDKTITSNTTTDSYSVTISKSTTNGKYYIKTASGYYIGSDANSTGSNELDASNSIKYNNGISLSQSNVTIQGTDHVLKYSYDASSSRFRYYKSSSQNVRLPQLYKKSGGTTYSAYTTLCDECTLSESLVLSANASTADLDIDGEATITFSTSGGNGGEIIYAANPKTGVTWENGTATFTKVGEYTITASQEKNDENCPTTSNTVNVTITAIPHLYFVTDPAPITIEFDPVECGGNTRVEDKKSVSVQAYNLAAAVTAQVTGPYKIARTSGATLNDYTTSLTLRNNITDGKINGDDDVIYILSFPPAGSSEPTEGTLTFTTTNGNTLTVNLSTPTITCTPRTLTFNDRGIKTTQEYYAGTEVPEPATPTGVCGEYEFDGWALAKVESGSTTYEKVEFPYIMPANNQTVLYAVYRYTEGPTNQYELVTEIESGKDYVIAAYDEPNGDFALTNSESSTNGKFTSVKVECDVNNIITTDNANIIWTVTGNDEEGYKFYNSAVKKYIEMYRSNGKSLLRLVDNCTNTFDVNIEMDENDDIYVDITSPEVDENYNVFSFYQELFNVYTRCDYNIYFYEQTATPFYTTTPDCHPSVTLISDGEVYVTATNGRGIMAATPLTLTTTDLAPNTEIAISSNSNDIYFSTERNTNFAMAQASQPKTSLTLTTNEGGELETPLYIHYKPSADGDGTPAEVVVTADVSTHNPPFTAQKTIHVRNLPAKFVIATKAGATWYALPANMNGATNPAAVVIEVDETTMTATAPNTTPYTLWSVATINGNTDRYKEFGERLRFAAVNNGNKGLWANNANKGTTINNNGAIVTRGDNPGAAYEWKVTTTIVDGNWQYTLQTDQANNQKYLRYWTAASGGAKWGTYESGVNTLYLLPMTEITEMNVEVMEWGTNSMALRFEGDAPANVDITLGETTTNVTLTNLNSGSTSDIYKVEGLALTTNDGEVLKIVDNTSNNIKLLCKPILVTGESVSTAYSTLETTVCDVVVLNGGKLSAGDAHVDFANIYVYPGGKLILDEKSLGAKQQVYLRGGYSWLNPTTYALPEVYLKGSVDFKGSGNIIYDYYIQNYKYYQFSLPYQVPLANVTDEAGVDNFPVWVKHYNGALRAVDANATSWEWYYGANFEAGIGYIIAAKPRQEDKVANRPLSIIRFPLGNSAFTGGEGDKSVVTTAHGIEGYKAGTVTANNVGWNFIGNPFMSTWKGNIGYKQLTKHPNEANWDGTYDWVDANIKYITIMSAESGSDYDQYIAADTDLKPFFPFYLQETADGGTGTINFAAANRIQKAPAMLSAETPREAFVQIEIEAESIVDQTGMFVGDDYSDEIDFDDYEKMFGSSTDKPKVWLMHEGKRMAFEAVTESTAAAYTAIGYRAPQTGKYMFAINEEASKLSDVEAVYLTDNQTGVTDFDLLSSAYEFESNGELYNDSRFTIRIVLRDESPGTTTGVENLLHFNSEQPMKFIYQDKMYILRNGIIYDAMGKQVKTINK